ncbi:MAG: helix-turn-helix domain-containing protein [Bacillota bacterium]
MVEDVTFLSVQEVADKLDKHPRTIYRWIKDNEINAYKIGGTLKITEEDLRKFIENSKIA